MMYEFSSVMKIFVLEKRSNVLKFNDLIMLLSLKGICGMIQFRKFLSISWKYQNKEILYLQNVELTTCFISSWFKDLALSCGCHYGILIIIRDSRGYHIGSGNGLVLSLWLIDIADAVAHISYYLGLTQVKYTCGLIDILISNIYILFI